MRINALGCTQTLSFTPRFLPRCRQGNTKLTSFCDPWFRDCCRLHPKRTQNDRLSNESSIVFAYCGNNIHMHIGILRLFSRTGTTNWLRRRDFMTFEWNLHYSDVIMSTMAFKITSLTIVYSTVYSGPDQRNLKALCHWPLCGKFTGDQWIPRK